MTQPHAKSASALSNAAVGAGLGSAAGLLTTLFREDPSVKDVVKHVLVGGGAGAAVGAGLGGLPRSAAPAPSPPTAQEKKPLLSPLKAGLSGLLPVVGPALYGGSKGKSSGNVMKDLATAGSPIRNSLGLGTGSLVGALPGNFMMPASGDPKKMLIASLVTMLGSGAGAAVTAHHSNKLQEKTAASQEEPKLPSELSPGLAALLGTIFPLLGPGAQGALGSSDGRRWDNAAGMTGASAIGLIGTPIGSGIASFIQARRINKQQGEDYRNQLQRQNMDKMFKGASSFGDSLKGMAANIGQQYGKAKEGLGGIEVQPFNPGSSTVMGGVGGAALGGGVGLLRALLDDNDDGIMGTLRKALQGAAVGGVGGAALGGGYSMLRRNNMQNALGNDIPNNYANEILDKYTVPLRAEIGTLTGSNPAKYRHSINRINGRAAGAHMLAPLVNHVDSRNNA